MKRLFAIAIPLLVLWGCTTQNNPTFKLTTTVSPVGAGTILPTQTTFNKGETAVLEAVPVNGWKFVRWEGDLSSSVNPVNLGMTRDYNIIGVFERRDYPLTITVDGQGSVSERVVTAKTTEYPFETIVELTPTPVSGWAFKEWSGDLSGSQNPARITVTGPKSVMAKFMTTPIVRTDSTSQITSSSARVYGNVTSDGSDSVTSRGVCYATTQNPSTTDNCVASGSGTGVFNVEISGLNFGATYYVRTYATNRVGTSYGSQLSFNTLPIAPVVVTGTVSYITAFGASVSAEVTQSGGATVTSRGVCYRKSNTSEPEAESCILSGTGSGTFLTSLHSLNSNTQYRAWAFATNQVGTSFGAEVTFSTQEFPGQIPTAGLVAWYPFTGNASDESSNANNGVVNGASLTSDRFDAPNSAYSFDGNDFIDLGRLAGLGDNPDSYSISLWIFMNDLPSVPNYPLFSKRHSASKSWTTALFGGTIPGVFTKGVINFLKDTHQHYTNGAASKEVVLGEWIHFVFVKDGNVLSVYQNGILASTVTDSKQLSGSDMNMYLGRQGAWNAYFRGKMDDVGIWNRALTPAEVQQLFN